MEKLYFMDREFAAAWFTQLDQALESAEVQLLFADSWYWWHYSFFGRDCICSEESDALRTQVLNLAAMLYKHHEVVVEKMAFLETELASIIQDLLDIVEESKSYPVSLWIYGDETSKQFLTERRASLPPAEQMQAFLDLPHFCRTRKERLHYRHINESAALTRYRNELADFNRRKKLQKKNLQRKAVPGLIAS
jgi:hypothetical protein